MPIGHHIAKCHHCGKEFVCGDCIPSICFECEQAGHKDSFFLSCPKCRPTIITRPDESDMITRPRANAMARQLEILQAECESLRTRLRDAELENTKMRVLLRQMSSFTAIYGEIASEEAGKLLASLGPKL